MRPIFLIGYMGCGKSALGRALSRLCGVEAIDLDAYIERRFCRSISQIWAERGETGFRDIEGRMLREVGEFDDVVIACGGGTPCFGDNIDYMNGRGTTVWIDTPISALHTRLCRNRSKRPLLADKSDNEILEFITSQLEQRRPHYSRATHRFEPTEAEASREVDNAARRFAKLYNIPIKE